MGTGEKITLFDEVCRYIYKNWCILCRYKFATNLQNFTQKDLIEVKIFQKVLGGYFWKHLVDS